MVDSQAMIRSLSNEDLLRATREIVRRRREVEANLLRHMAEIDERGLTVPASIRKLADRGAQPVLRLCAPVAPTTEGSAIERETRKSATEEGVAAPLVIRWIVYERGCGRCTHVDG
jgi:hypothetical protein